MSRLQIVLAVGLFLIVALFGWKTYLEKAAQKNRSDFRGLPIEFQEKVKAYKAKNPDPKPTSKTDGTKKTDTAGDDQKQEAKKEGAEQPALTPKKTDKTKPTPTE